MRNNYQKPAGSYISFMSNKVKTYGGINLAQGIPGFNPPKELTNILSKIANDNIHQYAPGNGNNELLDLLFNKYKTKKDRLKWILINVWQSSPVEHQDLERQL